MKTSIPRLRSVKFKGGAEVRVLHNDGPRWVMAQLVGDIKDIADQRAGETAAGYALVVWGYSGATSTILRINDSRQVGVSGAPEFVRNCVADHLITSR